jgi:hypothetical protein
MFPVALRTRHCIWRILIPTHLIIAVTTCSIADSISSLILALLITVISSQTTAKSARCSLTWTIRRGFVSSAIDSSIQMNVHMGDVRQTMIIYAQEISSPSIPSCAGVLGVGVTTGAITSQPYTADRLMITLNFPR